MDRTPVTSLHLGLVAMAKKSIAKRNKLAALHNTEIEAESPKSNEASPLPRFEDGEEDNLNFMANEKPMGQTTGSNRRAQSAPNGGRSGFNNDITHANGSTQPTRQEKQQQKKLTEAVQSINKMEDLFNAKETIREIRNRAYPWDAATNDNFYNSTRNDTAPRKAFSVYVEPSPHQMKISTNLLSSSGKVQQPHKDQRPKTASATPTLKAASRAPAPKHYLDDRCTDILTVAAAIEKEKAAALAAEKMRNSQQQPRASSASGLGKQSFYPPLHQQQHLSPSHQAHSPAALQWEQQQRMQQQMLQYQQQYRYELQIPISPVSEFEDDIGQEEIAQQQQRLRKLSALRRNVSFVDDVVDGKMTEAITSGIAAIGAIEEDNISLLDGVEEAGFVDVIMVVDGDSRREDGPLDDLGSSASNAEHAPDSDPHRRSKSLNSAFDAGSKRRGRFGVLRTSFDSVQSSATPLSFLYEEHLRGSGQVGPHTLTGQSFLSGPQQSVRSTLPTMQSQQQTVPPPTLQPPPPSQTQLVSASDDEIVVDVEAILNALKPHDAFLLDFRLEIASKFPFFVRKDGLLSDMLEVPHVPIEYCDADGHRLGVVNCHVALMLYDVGYILAGGADSQNMFAAAKLPPPVQHDPFGYGRGSESPVFSYSTGHTAPNTAPSSPHVHHQPLTQLARSSTEYTLLTSPTGQTQLRMPRTQQRLSMTLASLRQHPVGLATTAGILVAVRVLEVEDVVFDDDVKQNPNKLYKKDGSAEKAAAEALNDMIDSDGVCLDNMAEDLSCAHGHVFLTVAQLLRCQETFSRDAPILTVLHEMQSFAYAYAGTDQLQQHPNQNQKASTGNSAEEAPVPAVDNKGKNSKATPKNADGNAQKPLLPHLSSVPSGSFSTTASFSFASGSNAASPMRGLGSPTLKAPPLQQHQGIGANAFSMSLPAMSLPHTNSQYQMASDLATKRVRSAGDPLINTSPSKTTIQPLANIRALQQSSQQQSEEEADPSPNQSQLPQSTPTSSFAGQEILLVDEHQRQPVVYPCLLDMCDAEAVDSLVQPVLNTLRMRFVEHDCDEDGIVEEEDDFVSNGRSQSGTAARDSATMRRRRRQKVRLQQHRRRQQLEAEEDRANGVVAENVDRSADSVIDREPLRLHVNCLV